VTRFGHKGTEVHLRETRRIDILTPGDDPVAERYRRLAPLQLAHREALLTSSVLTQPTGNARPGLFGSAVAISGGTIVVGADGQPVGSTNAGAAFVFEEPAGGWSGLMTQDAELTPSDPANDEYFADAALAVSGSTVVVGAPGVGAPSGGLGHGAAYVFEGPATGWHGAMTQSAELTAPAGAGNDELGGSVAVSGGTVAVGAPALNVGSNVDQGAVFVYSEPGSGWSGVLSPAAELTASDGTEDNSFGTVAVSGSTIAVAESNRNPGSLNSVYLFTQPASGWSGHLTESSELVASNEAVTDAFGSDVALSCSTVAVGAPGHRRLGSTASQGAAYVFAPPTTTSADGAHQPEFQAPVPSLPPAGGCPLDVQVTVLENLRSGLAVDDGFRKEGPVNFTIPTYSRTGSVYSEPGEAGQKCESGCANVLVTVTDPLTGKAVAGAKVTATVDPINVHHYGSEFICAQSDEAKVPCGTEMSGLLTDQMGQVHLIYWAPGVVRQTSTVLRIAAQKACTADACPARLEVGQRNQTLQIKPYVIYEHTGELSKVEVEALVEMVRNPGLFSLTNELAKEGFKVPFEEALEWLVGEEEGAELAVESIPDIFAEPLFGLFEATHVAFELHEQDELVAAFLQAVALPGIGLDDPPRESKAPAPPSGLFESEILHGIANPLHLAAGGVVYDDAEILSGQLKKLNDQLAARPEEVHMAVYEVSNCDQADPSCGPGYKYSDGIKPQLCFNFDGSDGYPGAWADSFCINQYDAFAFAESMGHRLNTALQ